MALNYYSSEALKEFAKLPEKYEDKVKYIEFLKNFPLETYEKYSNFMTMYYLNDLEKLDEAIRMREIFEFLQKEIVTLLKSFNEFAFDFLKEKDIYLDFKHIVYWMDLFVYEFIPFREKFKQDVIKNLIKNAEIQGFKAINLEGSVKIIKPMKEYVEIETISFWKATPKKSSTMIELSDLMENPDDIELDERVYEIIEELYPEIVF